MSSICLVHMRHVHFLLLTVTHTLREFWTSSCEVPNFPEFVSVGVLNEHTIYYFDSITRRTVIKQEWMNKIIEEEPKVQEWRTLRDINREQVDKARLQISKLQFNQTEGIHILQRMVGCEWDDETDKIRGYHQTAFDGEDFIWFDWDTQTFVAAKSQAFATKLQWEKNGEALNVNYEVTHLCANYLKKFVRIGDKAIKRKGK
uniref:MHC class I-like antigen recognition-like domain-containing protein n=1 Tax=Neogobius melanostomus TaxID=47308 RepID=A0A8C6WHK1_9GOBI